jgi:hypothetical protein
MTPPAARIGAGHRRGVSGVAPLVSETLLARALEPDQVVEHRVLLSPAAHLPTGLLSLRLRLVRAAHPRASCSAARYFVRSRSAAVQFVPERQA